MIILLLKTKGIMREATGKVKCVCSRAPWAVSLLIAYAGGNPEPYYVSQSGQYSPVLSKTCTEWPLSPCYQITLNTDSMQLSDMMGFCVLYVY